MGDQGNVKAFWRAAKASLALEKTSEAEKFCEKGLELFPHNSELTLLLKEIRTARVRLQEERNRIDVGKAEAVKLEKAMVQRGVKHQVDSEKFALIELGPGIFGSDAPRATVNSDGNLLLPVVFMYPPLSQFDFVQSACEDTCLLDHLTEMFAQPAPWDPEFLYRSVLTMSVYILPINQAILNDESREKLIYRVNLRTPLSRLLGSVIKCYELGMLSFYVLPNLNEKNRFERKFEGYNFIDI